MDWLPLKSKAKLEHFVDLVIDGELIPPPPFRELMVTSLSSGLDFENIMATEDNERRVNIVYSCFPWLEFRRLLGSLDHALKKNDMVMKVLMKRGDELIGAGINKKALHCYTLALCFAPTEESNIPEAWMNRSAILFDMEKFDSALMDLENAEKALLDQDRADRIREIGLNSKKKACQDKIAPELKDEETLKREEYRDEIIGKVQARNNPTLSELPDFVSVKYNKFKGRYLVANRPVDIGTTILVEEPYVSVIVDQLKWQTKHCNRCLKEASNPIPCKGCTYYIYCGDQCRIDDYNHGHEFECPALPYLHSMKLTRIFHLCFKAICTTGPAVLKALYMKSKSVKRVEDAWHVPANVTPENLDRYEQVLNMASHNRPCDLPFLPWIAVSLAHILRVKTTFFNTIEEIEKSNFEKFVGTLYMHYSKSFPYNTMTLGDTGGIEVKDVEAYYESGLGGMVPIRAEGVFPASNLMNHSCVATTFRQDLPGGRIAIVTNQKLEAGDECSHGYGIDYLKDSISNRKSHLYQNHSFTCNCVACTKNWPLLSDMRTAIFTDVCQPCKNHIQNLLSTSAIHKVKVRRFKCGACTSRTQTGPNIEPCDYLSYILEIGNELVMKNKPLDALPLIKECIKHFQKDRQPSTRLIFSQTRLMDSYNLITNTIKQSDLSEEDEQGGLKIYNCSIV